MDAEGGRYLILECKLCEFSIYYNSLRQKDDTVSPARLWSHVKNAHSKTWKRELDEILNESQTNMQSFAQDTRSGKRIKASDVRPQTSELVSLFIENQFPFRAIERPKMRQFVCKAHGEGLPSRRSLVRWLRRFAQEERQSIKDELFDVNTLTCCADIWSSVDHKNFLLLLGTYIDSHWCMRTRLLDLHTLEGRHTAEDIRESFQTIAEDMGLSFENQVTGFVTDSGTLYGYRITVNEPQ